MPKYDLIVSLGGNCATAIHLRERGLRMFSLPLDYVFMVDEKPIKYLCEVFRNNFENFCKKENLVELQGDERGDDRTGKMQYKDEYTGFRLIHHFVRPIEEPGAYEEAKEILNRRINRLLSKIEQHKKYYLYWLLIFVLMLS